MTVISKNQNHYAFPNSNANSDTESLHLAGSAATSDAESVDNERINTNTTPRRPRLKPLYHFDENSACLKSFGRRKLRRYQNRSTLQTLNEDDDEENFIVFETPKSPLTQLLDDPLALKRWNEFMEKSEEEQEEILDSMDLHRSKCDDCQKKEKPFSRISSKIRRMLKIRKNLSVANVKLLEDEVVVFFKNTPQEKYIKFPSSSFDRLLTHAIAQYHCLSSFGCWENERRKVEVFNLKENWTPAECLLHEFIHKIKCC